eukprot:g48390.t1
MWPMRRELCSLYLPFWAQDIRSEAKLCRIILLGVMGDGQGIKKNDLWSSRKGAGLHHICACFFRETIPFELTHGLENLAMMIHQSGSSFLTLDGKFEKHFRRCYSQFQFCRAVSEQALSETVSHYSRGGAAVSEATLKGSPVLSKINSGVVESGSGILGEKT